MSSLPSEIHIKRKATDDPVELLHVQNEGNHIRQYVFKRQRTSFASQSQSSTPSSKNLNYEYSSVGTLDMADSASPRNVGGGRNRSGIRPAAVTNNEKSPNALNGGFESNRFTDKPADLTSINSSSKTDGTSGTEPRRFHLSRDCTFPISESGISSRRRRPRGNPTVFIERKRVPQRPPARLHLTSKYSGSSLRASEGSASTSGGQQNNSIFLENEVLGSRELMKKSTEASALTVEILAYTNQVAEQKYAESSKGPIVPHLPPLIKTREVSSFKERFAASKPQQPYLEQAVETEQLQDYKEDEVMVDVIESEGEDSDYVMDIYVRMPAQMFGLQDQKNYGLLVLDSEPNIDETYHDDSDGKSDMYDDEDEDENAENHPSNDYPDEEDAFKDEYERERYDYRYQNSFDTQDFDDDMSSSSDDDKKQGRVRRPWMTNATY